MRYLPFGEELMRQSHILVDSGRLPSTILELSHWPKNRTPLALKADTSTEIVLNYLDQTRVPHADYVSADHYDIDGLLSVWCLLYPSEARRHREALINAAVTGDFDRFTTEDAAAFCLRLDAIEERELQPQWSGSSTDAMTAFLYTNMLSRVTALIADPGFHAGLATDAEASVRQSRQALADGSARLTERADLDLAIVESSEPLHAYAVNAATECLRVLTIVGGREYSLYYRYESFVDLHSRQARSRIRLEGLAARLNTMESDPGEWFCESVASSHPRLQRYARMGVVSSGLTPEQFIDVATTWLAQGEQDPSLQWDPRGGWLEEPYAPVPPSLRAAEDA